MNNPTGMLTATAEHFLMTFAAVRNYVNNGSTKPRRVVPTGFQQNPSRRVVPTEFPQNPPRRVVPTGFQQIPTRYLVPGRNIPTGMPLQ